MHLHVHLGADADTGIADVVELDRIGPEETREIRKELDCFRNDALYFNTHRDEFLARYPEQWVAVYREQVVAVAGELSELFHQIDANGAPRGRVYIEYACDDDEDRVLFLP